MRLSLRLAIPLALLLREAGVSAAEEPPDFGKAARDIGDFLVSSARKEGKSVFWAQYEGPGPGAAGEKTHFPVSFYTGLAGTGYFLLNLFKHTGDRKYLEAAAGAGERLISVAKDDGKGGLCWRASCDRNGREVPDGERSGLYSGGAGLGLFLEFLHAETGSEIFRKASDAAFAAVLSASTREGRGLHWEHSFKDLIGGEAGIALALFRKNSLSPRKEWVEAGRSAAAWLLSDLERQEGRVRWKTFGGYDPNFSHGVAGIGFALEIAALECAEGGPEAQAAALWVRDSASPSAGGGLVWKYYAEPPPEGKRNWVMNAWCHGAPGTVRLFLLRHLLHGDRTALEVACRGSLSIAEEAKLSAEKPFFYNPTLCCGAAGCVEAFCLAHEFSGEAKWLDLAKKAAEAMLSMMRLEKGARIFAEYDAKDKDEKNPYFPTGFMQGNSGIGFTLLELDLAVKKSGKELLYFPDHPKAHGRK